MKLFKRTIGNDYVLVTTFEGIQTDITCFDDAESLFETASRIFAYSDLADVSVDLMLIKGKKCFYSGWQPDMIFEFENSEGKIVYSTCHPEWNH